MNLRDITGLRDKDLRAEGITVAEGRILVERALASDWEFLGAFLEPKARDLEPQLSERCECKVVDAHTMSSVAGYPFHRGVLLVLRRPAVLTFDQLRDGREVRGRTGRWVACPDVENAENLGAIMRSIVAFGFDGVLVDPRTTDPWGRRALKTSMGAPFTLPVARVKGPGDLGDRPLICSVLSPAATPLSEFSPPESYVVAFGNEGRGLDERWVEAANHLTTIPMPPSVDSLNVGVAAGIVMYSLSRPAGRSP